MSAHEAGGPVVLDLVEGVRAEDVLFPLALGELSCDTEYAKDGRSKPLRRSASLFCRDLCLLVASPLDVSRKDTIFGLITPYEEWWRGFLTMKGSRILASYNVVLELKNGTPLSLRKMTRVFPSRPRF